MRILLVEDELSGARFIAKGLREAKHAVDIATDGIAASRQCQENDYDAVILDVMLPGKDGLAVCRDLRAAGSDVPVLMLTARDAVEARVQGLDAGADDYLTKPLDFRELAARARAGAHQAGSPSARPRADRGGTAGHRCGWSARLDRRTGAGTDQPRVRAARVPRAARGRGSRARRHRRARMGRELRPVLQR